MVALAALHLLVSLAGWFHQFSFAPILVCLALLSLSTSSVLWIRDILREASYQGSHTRAVQDGLKTGLILLLGSEVLLFGAFFWAHFYLALTPSIQIGGEWPPLLIQSTYPWYAPILGTLILLLSGATVTYTHSAILAGSIHRTKSLLGITLTVMLGGLFTVLQIMEYKENNFTIADSAFGSVFYMTTGLHGIHVIIGTGFLIIALFQLITYSQIKNHHLLSELAILYWHFVDIVWLAVFVIFYVWDTPINFN
jgi:cytochrome c oxidase subunit 3